MAGVDHDDFFTDTHFLDYDVIVLDPFGALSGNQHEYPVYDNVMPLKYESGPAFHRRYIRITNKLLEFINKGGMAIVFMRFMPTMSYPDPHVRGRGNVTQDLNVHMPWGKSTTRKVRGSNITFTTDGPFGRFWSTTEGMWHYAAVYDESSDLNSLAHVKGHTDQVVADCILTVGGGFCIQTPVLSFEDSQTDPDATKKSGERFIQAVADLYQALRADAPKPHLPDWADDYRLPGETPLRETIQTAREEINALQDQINQRTTDVDGLVSHKALFTGHDNVLEAAVDRVLTDLGMKVEPGPKGRVDRVAVFGDRKFAVEVQGVKKGAKEDHARALTQWVQEIAIQDGKEPKGLLIINPYRETPLDERTANLWPGRTLEVCEQQGHCAMTGIQLLGLYFDAIGDEKKREHLIDKMFATRGAFEGYEDWKTSIKSISSKANHEK